MNLTEELFTRRASNLQPEWLAEILGRLVWILDDNGAEIAQTLKGWLRGDDPERIAVALAFDELLLADTREEMRLVINHVCRRFPEFRAQCEAITRAWGQG